MVSPLSILLLGLASVPGVCPGAAAIEATDGMREPLVAALEAAGVRVVDGSKECAPIRAEVMEAESGGFALRIEDPSGRTSSREVASLATAAVLIESWSVVEPELLALPALEPSPIVSAPEAVVTAPVPEPRPSRVRLSAMAETAVGQDGSVLFGPGLELCARFGWACIDVLARFGYGFGPAEVGSTGTRTLLGELSVGASVHFDLGPVVLAPGAGTSVAWLRTAWRGDEPIPCPPDEPCLIGAEPAPPGPRERLRPRAHLFLTALFPVADALSIEARAGAAWSPLAEEVVVGRSFASPDGSGATIIDVLREPRFSFLFGAGVLFGL